jgi:hypothetical protein
MISPETWNLRQEVLQKYGGRCACVCGCGDANLRRLQLHHIHGNGNDDRKSMRGMNQYTKLMANPIDPTLEPLCVGCHWEHTMFGNCDGGLSQAVETDDDLTPKACTGGVEEPRHNGGIANTPRLDAGVFDFPREPMTYQTPTPEPKRRWGSIFKRS